MQCVLRGVWSDLVVLCVVCELLIFALRVDSSLLVTTPPTTITKATAATGGDQRLRASSIRARAKSNADGRALVKTGASLQNNGLTIFI